MSPYYAEASEQGFSPEYLRMAAAFVVPSAIAAAILWNLPYTLAKLGSLAAGLALLSWGPVLVFQGASYITATTPERHRGALQFFLLVFCWLIPLFYFSRIPSSLGSILDRTDYPGTLGISIFLGWVAYAATRAALKDRPFLPIRAFLIALGVVTALSIATKQNFHFSDDDEEGSALSDEPSPTSGPERAFLHYIIYSASMFAGITIALASRRELR